MKEQLDYQGRKITKNWLATQECTIVANWNKTKIDLWQVLDIYAEAALEGDDTQDALLRVFGDIADHIEVETTSNSNFKFLRMMRHFNGCPQMEIYFKGENVDNIKV